MEGEPVEPGASGHGLLVPGDVAVYSTAAWAVGGTTSRCELARWSAAPVLAFRTCGR